MRILMDRNAPLAEAFFGELGEVTRMVGREITAEHVRDQDILIVRSNTRVDAGLLEGSRVRFVATCTIGTDHVDLDYLRDHGIGFASAPGSNADSVGDYVLASLLALAEQEGAELRSRRVGIVGAGSVGSRLWQRLQRLGVECLVCDPPRAEAENRDDFVDLDTLLERADVVCLHTPLVREGNYPTHHLLDESRIETLEPGTWLINAGRGPCVDNAALRRRLERHADLRTVFDVWEGEPDCDEGLLPLVDIATPHIAGHSLDGKMRGTEMAYQGLVEYCGLPRRHTLEQLAPPPWLRTLAIGAETPPQEALALCARACCDVHRDKAGFLHYIRRFGTARGFDRYRAEYPVRREFSTLGVELVGDDEHGLGSLLEAAGFRVKH